MQKGSFKRFLCLLCAGVMMFGLIACGGQGAAPDQAGGVSSGADAAQSTEATKAEDTAKPVNLKFFSNMPDQTAGMGLAEKTLVDEYMKANPNVKIEIEALQDEPYKQKFKAYIASNELPDLFQAWGFRAFFEPVMKGGFAAELNKDDYKDYTFLPTSMDGFSYDGKLYGLPRNTDYYVMYYNKGLFDQAGVKVPTTFQELLDATKALRAKGIQPCSTNGKDKWAIISFYHNLYLLESGESQLIYDAVARKTKFADNPVFLKAAQDLKALMDVGFFQDSFVSADYGAARNLFTQEKAAMYYMGSWEIGMQSDTSFPESFRNNVSAFMVPVIEGGKGKDTDLFGMYGGGYAVSSASPSKDEAVKLLNFMLKPDNWSKIGWQSGGVISAQDITPYATGKETQLQKTMLDILHSATSMSGQNFCEASAPSFKTASQDLGQTLAAGIITPEKFIEELDKAADKANAELN